MDIHLNGGDRPLYNLSAAIERGDLTAARMWLDYLEHYSQSWRDEIEKGRFSPEAKGLV